MNQVIWISPTEVRDSHGAFKPATHSGVVLGGDWDLRTYPVESNPIAMAAIRHWRDGLSWEEAGAYEIQLLRIERYGPAGADGQRRLDDIVARFARLDSIFETVREERRLRPHKGWDGVYIHLARDGRPVFGQRGVHRFVMSQLLDLPEIPAHLGVYHPEVEGDATSSRVRSGSVGDVRHQAATVDQRP